MVILPEENWKRLCAAPQYVLPSSLPRCFRVAGKQLSNSLESNCFLVMGWIDIRLFFFVLRQSCLFPPLPSPTKRREPSRERSLRPTGNTCCLDKYNPRLRDSEFLRVCFNWCRTAHPKWGRVVSSRLRRPFMGVSYHHGPVRPRRAEEKRTHPAELTGFILLTVTAICTAKNIYIQWQFF